MKLVLFDEYRPGVLRNNEIIDISLLLQRYRYDAPQSMVEAIITHWSELEPRIDEVVRSSRGIPLSQVRLRPPLPRPGKILCAAVNYLEFGQRSPAELDCFLKSSHAVVGPGDIVELPPVNATIFHHEAELAVVMGRVASNICQDEAMDYVFGYINFMDISARGFSPNGRLSFFMGKSWNTFAPIGPAIVTADEIPEPHLLDVKLWVNGNIRHDFNTQDMAHKIPRLIEFCSSVTTLEPGDIISTGTNHQGIGAIQDGDIVSMEITELGRLTVTVQDTLKRSWHPGIDHEFAKKARGG